jgi:hypothetical protein
MKAENKVFSPRASTKDSQLDVPLGPDIEWSRVLIAREQDCRFSLKEDRVKTNRKR